MLLQKHKQRAKMTLLRFVRIGRLLHLEVALKAFPLCGRPESQIGGFLICANRLVVTPRRWLRVLFPQTDEGCF